MFKAFDDTFSQTIYSRTSYVEEEIIWGAKFSSMVGVDKEGARKLQLDQMDVFEKANLM